MKNDEIHSCNKHEKLDDSDRHETVTETIVWSVLDQNVEHKVLGNVKISVKVCQHVCFILTN